MKLRTVALFNALIPITAFAAEPQNIEAGFEIRETALETDDPQTEGRGSWWHTVSELSKGVEYLAEYEVPVYRKM